MTIWYHEHQDEIALFSFVRVGRILVLFIETDMFGGRIYYGVDPEKSGWTYIGDL